MSPRALRVSSRRICSGCSRNCRFRLRVDLIRASEPVEVVDVERTEVDLQRLEDVRQLDAVALHALAIDVRLDLRHAHLEAREQSGQRRLLLRLCHAVLQLRIEVLEPGAGAILDVELEAADLSQPLHGRRREDRDDGLLDLAEELAIQLLHDRVGPEVAARPLLCRLQDDERDPGIGCVHESVDRQTREGDRAADARDASSQSTTSCE